MTDGLKSDAIAAALAQNWDKAVSINAEILKEEPENIDALNRIGFAYLQKGDTAKSKSSFDKVIKLDAYNPIARKNLTKIDAMKKGELKPGALTTISPLLFLEEPGKTKIVECVNAAQTATLSTLTCGQTVDLKAKKHSIEIRDAAGTYIGALPDDVAFKLIKLLEAGNEYSAHIKSVGKTCVSLFIRETKRGKRIHQPSFISTTSYLPFSRDDNSGAEKPDTSATGEEEEASESKE